MKAMKFLTIFVMALTFATLSNSQTTPEVNETMPDPVNETTPGPVDEGSGTEPPESFTGTTEGGSGACDGKCESGSECPTTCSDECPEDCKCADGLKRSLNNICAEPCSPVNEATWCLGSGQECVTDEESPGYSCVCGGNYYSDEGGEGNCMQALVFGGQMTFTTTYDEAEYGKMKRDIEKILSDMYSNNEDFKKADVLDLRKGSIIADYKLSYYYYSSVTEKDVLDSYLNYTDGCQDEFDTPAGGSEYPINCTASNETVTDNSQLCAYYGPALNCDNRTAVCGYVTSQVTCVCKEPYKYGKTYADAKLCEAALCVADSDCNPPFGECNVDKTSDILKNFCDCTVFGWSGSNCEDPWEFVFTIVTAGLGLILIGVLTACICMSQKGKSDKKSQKQEELDLQNPFVDFQPGIVRAKVPSNMYSISDSYEAPNGGGQSHTNGAYNSAYDDGNARQTSTFAGAQGKPQKNDYEYF